jgi:hypothetical protein
MTPQQQIRALMASVATPPDVVAPCRANKTHTIDLLVRWEDDLSLVPTANFQIYRGNGMYLSDMVAKGRFGKRKVPPGTYRIFFPDIHDTEIVEE